MKKKFQQSIKNWREKEKYYKNRKLAGKKTKAPKRDSDFYRKAGIAIRNDGIHDLPNIDFRKKLNPGHKAQISRIFNARKNNPTGKFFKIKKERGESKTHFENRKKEIRNRFDAIPGTNGIYITLPDYIQAEFKGTKLVTKNIPLQDEILRQEFIGIENKADFLDDPQGYIRAIIDKYKPESMHYLINGNSAKGHGVKDPADIDEFIGEFTKMATKYEKNVTQFINGFVMNFYEEINI